VRRRASDTGPAAAQGFAATRPEEHLTISLRTGVPFPDWSVVRSGSARATLVAMLEAAWDRRAWQGHTPAEDAVRRTIVQLYGELGHAPTPEEIARRCCMPSRPLRALLDRLASRDLVVLEGERITGAYPLTDRPTEHQVGVEGQRLHAMCAIDALGVGAMYATSTVIESRCCLCRAPIHITAVDRGRRLETVLPAAAVVFASIGYRGGRAATSLCTTIAFFCGDAHLCQWRSAQPLDGPGFRLSIEEVFAVGKAIFGPVLAPPASEDCLEPTG
jgi:mercuric reductase